MEDHGAVIVFHHLMFFDLHHALGTLRAASLAAGKKIHGHRWRLPEKASRFATPYYALPDG
jgi:hypothetical protein